MRYVVLVNFGVKIRVGQIFLHQLRAFLHPSFNRVHVPKLSDWSELEPRFIRWRCPACQASGGNGDSVFRCRVENENLARIFWVVLLAVDAALPRQDVVRDFLPLGIKRGGTVILE
jgi:hypothetical protein